MEINMKAVFNREEIGEMAKKEFIKELGEVKKGYALHASETYGQVTVEMCKEPEPEPIKSTGGTGSL